MQQDHAPAPAERQHFPVRPADLALAALALACLAVAGTFVHARQGVDQGRASLARQAELVERLGLTDLALFTEARYTRHPSQADHNAPFQDHPLALEHFPSGSVLPPAVLGGER
ncbi:MAG TPA: hypothetical protein VK196_21380 [Magnetospirillum sp.]|nr:hypothetical protein [Magnetospirillum sp.]